MGSVDRDMRLLIAALIVTLYFANAISGIAGIVLIILSILFVLTSFVGFCPLYLPLGISSLKRKSKSN